MLEPRTLCVAGREQLGLDHGVRDREVDLHAVDRDRAAEIEHELRALARRALAGDPLALARRSDRHGREPHARSGQLDRQRLASGEQQVASREPGQLDAAALDPVAGLVESREPGVRVDRREVDQVVARLDAQRDRELGGLIGERELERDRRARQVGEIEQIGRGQRRSRLAQHRIGTEPNDRAVGGEHDRDVARLATRSADRARCERGARRHAEQRHVDERALLLARVDQGANRVRDDLARGVEHAQVGQVRADRAAVDRQVEQQRLERIAARRLDRAPPREIVRRERIALRAQRSRREREPERARAGGAHLGTDLPNCLSRGREADRSRARRKAIRQVRPHHHHHHRARAARARAAPARDIRPRAATRRRPGTWRSSRRSRASRGRRRRASRP